MRMPQLKCHDRWSTVAQRIKYVSKSTRSMQLSGCACAKCINMQWQKGNFVVNATQVWKFTFSMNFTLLNYRPLKKYRKDTVRHFVFVLFSLRIIGASYFRFNCEVNCLFECDDYWNSNGDCKYFDMQVKSFTFTYFSCLWERAVDDRWACHVDRTFPLVGYRVCLGQCLVERDRVVSPNRTLQQSEKEVSTQCYIFIT